MPRGFARGVKNNQKQIRKINENKQTCVSMHINLFKDLKDSEIPDIDIENEELKQISVNDVEKAQRYLRLKAIKYEKYILS